MRQKPRNRVDLLFDTFSALSGLTIWTWTYPSQKYTSEPFDTSPNRLRSAFSRPAGPFCRQRGSLCSSCSTSSSTPMSFLHWTLEWNAQKWDAQKNGIRWNVHSSLAFDIRSRFAGEEKEKRRRGRLLKKNGLASQEWQLQVSPTSFRCRLLEKGNNFFWKWPKIGKKKLRKKVGKRSVYDRFILHHRIPHRNHSIHFQTVSGPHFPGRLVHSADNAAASAAAARHHQAHLCRFCTGHWNGMPKNEMPKKMAYGEMFILL